MQLKLDFRVNRENW